MDEHEVIFAAPLLPEPKHFGYAYKSKYHCTSIQPLKRPPNHQQKVVVMRVDLVKEGKQT